MASGIGRAVLIQDALSAMEAEAVRATTADTIVVGVAGETAPTDAASRLRVSVLHAVEVHQTLRANPLGHVTHEIVQRAAVA